MTKVETIKIRNFKGLDKIEKDVHSSNVYVVGGNGRGKTSFIDAVWTTLTGKNIPSEPIKAGENSAEIEIELTDHVAILEFTKNKKGEVKQSFKLVQKSDGEFVKQPRTVLNELIGVIDFDPAYFFRLSAQKQIDYFCSLVGLDFNDIDKKIAELYDERTFRNKEMTKLKSLENSWFDEEIANRKPVDVKELFERKIVEQKKVDNMTKVMSGIETRKQRIAEIESELSRLKSEIAGAEEWIKNPNNIPISSEEFEKIQFTIDTAETENKLIAEHVSARETSIAMNKVMNDIRDIENEMTSQKELKKQKLSESIDIPNLEFDGDRFLFNGLPFESTQINTASQLIAGLRIGLKLLNGVRILKFDGSLIDETNMKLIDQWSKENDVQLFVEQVDRAGGKLEIKIDEQ